MSRTDKYFKKIRPVVLERDGHKCVNCNCIKNLEVHHVYGYDNDNLDDLQTLCTTCHNSAPMGEEYWEWLKVQDNVKPFLNPFDKMKRARKFYRLEKGKCEGRKAFGEDSISEKETVERIKELSKQQLSCGKIAIILDRENRITRMGKNWNRGTVWAIIKRYNLGL